MTVDFDKSFLKPLTKINHQPTLAKVKKTILTLEKASSLQEVSSVKKLTGFDTFYRTRIGDYRIGLEATNPATVRLLIVAHRKDIYRKFP